jgi:hypothetical protein
MFKRTLKKCTTILLLLICAHVLKTEILAHQPRLVEGETTKIENPEISQAFYTKLEGKEKLFIIENEQRFNLYVQITVADLESSETDYYFKIEKYNNDNLELVTKLNGKDYNWKPFYEEFAGDDYLIGPEYEDPNAAGKYLITLGSDDNLGEAILVTGRIESFPPGEIANTYKVLPEIKEEFFDKPSVSAYTNKASLFILLPVLFVVSIVIGFIIIKKRRKNQYTTT